MCAAFEVFHGLALSTSFFVTEDTHYDMVHYDKMVQSAWLILTNLSTLKLLILEVFCHSQPLLDGGALLHPFLKLDPLEVGYFQYKVEVSIL